MTSDKIDDAAKSYLNEAVSEQQKILQKYRIALEVMERYHYIFRNLRSGLLQYGKQKKHS
jgi:hypothetical protein